MSHQIAYVRFDADGLIMFAEYNGTAGQIIPALYSTEAALHEGWRTLDALRVTCTCGCADEPAVYYETYGGGTHGPARACRTCKAITSAEEWNTTDGACAEAWKDGPPTWADEVGEPW